MPSVDRGKIFFEIRKSKDRNVVFQEPILGVSILPSSLHSSTLELAKMVYI